MPTDSGDLIASALELGRELRDARRPERRRLSREAMLREACALAGVADVAALEEQAEKVRGFPFLRDRVGHEARALATGDARAPGALADEPNRGQSGMAAYLERLHSGLSTAVVGAVAALWAVQHSEQFGLAGTYLGTEERPGDGAAAEQAVLERLAAVDQALAAVLLVRDLAWEDGRAFLVAGELRVEIQGAGAIGTAIAEAVATPVPRLVEDRAGGFRMRA